MYRTSAYLVIVLIGLFIACSPQTGAQAQVKASDCEQFKAELRAEIKKELRAELKDELRAEILKELSLSSSPPPSTPSLPTTTTPQPQNAEAAKQQLLGTWRWVETRFSMRGRGNRIESPETMGIQRTVVFKEDNTVDISINNFKAYTYVYKVSQQSDGPFIDFFSEEPIKFLNKGPLLFEDNLLQILGGYNDRGGNISFIR